MFSGGRLCIGGAASGAGPPGCGGAGEAGAGEAGAASRGGVAKTGSKKEFQSHGPRMVSSQALSIERRNCERIQSRKKWLGA